MVLVYPIIAEVYDKMLSWPALVAWVASLVLLAWFLGRKKKWMLFIPAPITALFAWGTIDQMRDPRFGPVVVQELGYGYWVVSLLPIIAVVVVTCLPVKKPIQPPQRNAGSRPPPDDSPASETPSSLGPRGSYEDEVVKREADDGC